MTSAPVRESIANQAISEEKPPHQIEKRAFAYANEVASHQSYRVIRLFHAILTWLWNKLYEGIEVSQIDTPKELAESHEIVYIPCHRSHIDYLLLSYVLYLNGLTPPHIAAGKNLNLPLLAPLLRRCGAFFMRRSFQGDTLYRAVFDEYMHLMFVRGYSVEYFIEGGRSRTGRTLAPRTGMLSMTVRSFQRDSSKPIVFLPVYFGYERILEASTYIGELTGLSKKDESLLDLFGIFRTFKHTFGKVSVSFGEPVDLSRFLDQELPGWQSHLENPADFSKACTSLSIQLASNINDAATVNPINLVATALLCTPRQTMGLHRLENQVSVLQSLAQTGGKRNTSTTTSLSPTEVIIQAEKVTGIKRNQEGFGDILYAPPESAVLLTYYRNNTQHLFVLTSLIARMLRINATLSGSDIIDRCMVLAPYLRAELFLGWTLDRLPEKCNETLNAMASLGLIKLDNEVVSIPPRTTEEYAALLELGEIVEPILERFHIVTSLLSEDQQQSVENLEKSASDIAHQLSAIYGINSPEFFDRSLFARFISTLKSEGCIGAIKEDESTNDNFFHLKNTIEANLDADVLYNVLQSVTQVTKLSAITDSEKHQNDSLLQTN